MNYNAKSIKCYAIASRTFWRQLEIGTRSVHLLMTSISRMPLQNQDAMRLVHKSCWKNTYKIKHWLGHSNFVKHKNMRCQQNSSSIQEEEIFQRNLKTKVLVTEEKFQFFHCSLTFQHHQSFSPAQVARVHEKLKGLYKQEILNMQHKTSRATSFYTKTKIPKHLGCKKLSGIVCTFIRVHTKEGWSIYQN